MGARSFAVFLGVAAILGLLIFGLASKGTAALHLGQPVPDKPLPRLEGAGTGSIRDYRGHWVLVNLWASWCEPCRTESPVLERFYRANRKRNLIVLGIDAQDNATDARRFAAEPNHHYPALSLTYPILRSVGDERTRAFGMTGFPENFLVDPAGALRLIRRGPVTAAYLRSHVLPLVEGRR